MWVGPPVGLSGVSRSRSPFFILRTPTPTMLPLPRGTTLSNAPVLLDQLFCLLGVARIAQPHNTSNIKQSQQIKKMVLQTGPRKGKPPAQTVRLPKPTVPATPEARSKPKPKPAVGSPDVGKPIFVIHPKTRCGSPHAGYIGSHFDMSKCGDPAWEECHRKQCIGYNSDHSGGHPPPPS